MSSNVLFRDGKFVYKVLTKDQRDSAGMVLSRAFCTEPVVDALAENKPEMKAHLHDWVEFVEFWMDHCSSNELSVYALDEEEHRIAGVFIVRDLFWYPDNFEKTYNNKSKVLTPWMNFLWYLDEQAGKNFEPMKNPKQGDFVDLWFLGVHPDYRGNKIANNLIKGILPLIKEAGFKYATIEATSAFTSKAATFNEFQNIFEIEAKDWLWEGSPLYTNANSPHGTWTFWAKEL